MRLRKGLLQVIEFGLSVLLQNGLEGAVVHIGTALP